MIRRACRLETPSGYLAYTKAKESFLPRKNEPVAAEQNDVHQTLHESDEETNDCSCSNP